MSCWLLQQQKQCPRYRSVLWQLLQQQSVLEQDYSEQRTVSVLQERCRSSDPVSVAGRNSSGTLQERPLAPAAAATVLRGALQEQFRVAPAAAETVSGSVTGASCGSCSRKQCRMERCRSVLWLLQQQKQCLGALQECPVSSYSSETRCQRYRSVL